MTDEGNKPVEGRSFFSEEVIDRLRRIQDDTERIGVRVARLEQGRVPSLVNASGSQHEVTAGRHLAGASSNTGPERQNFSPDPAGGSIATDVQGEYQSIKESLSRITLPPDLRVNDSRQGIRRGDQVLYNVVTKCARFTETALKSLSQTSDCDNENCSGQHDQLVKILQAEISYLQDEFAAIAVQGQFDPNVSRFFRTLQRNTSVFSPLALDNLRNATAISAMYRPQRGRGFNRGSRGAFRGRGDDVFSQFSGRNFSHRRQNYNSTGNTGGQHYSNTGVADE